VIATPSPQFADRPNLARAVALSLLVHLGLGLWLLRLPSALMPPNPLQVRLAPAPTAPTLSPPSPSFPRLAREQPIPMPQPANPAAPGIEETPAATATAPGPDIDIDAALATARALGKEARSPSTPAPAARSPATVEAAIARATQPDLVVESRGANGEWVTQDRRTRCVARIQRKWFEDGVTLLPLCELKKG